MKEINKNKTIFLVDYITSGHHGNYVVLFSQVLINLGYSVVLLYPEKLKAFDALDGDKFNIFQVEPLSESSYRFQSIKFWIRSRKDIVNASKQFSSHPDLVYFMWADDLRFPQDRGLLNWLYRFYVEKVFGYKWSGLYFHPSHYRINAPERKVLDKVFSFKNCVGITVLDEGIVKSFKEYIGNEVYVIPDITFEEEKELDFDLQGKINNFANGRFIVSCVGAIERRKGVIELLKIFQDSSDFIVVVAGRLRENSFKPDEFKEYCDLKSKCTNVYELDKFLSHEEINTIYEESKFVWAAYKDFPHSSGVMTLAAISRKPVIVNKGYLMHERVERYQSGVIIDLNDLEQAKNIISEKLNSNWNEKVFLEYQKDFSIETFSEDIKHFISSNLNK